MAKWIGRWSNAMEFAAILLLAIGGFVVASLLQFARAAHGPIVFGNARLLGTVGPELVAAAACLAILRLRGWTSRDIPFRFTITGTLGGVLLVPLCLIFVVGFGDLLKSICGPAAFRMPDFVIADSLLVAAVVAAVNPVFEEFVFLGYVVRRLEPRLGAAGAVACSTVLRLMCHLYQGGYAITTIVPLGLVFGFVFIRRRNLWPLILAHAIFDFTALAPRQ